MGTEVPNSDRIEELVAQVEYQGGGDYVRVCQPRTLRLPAVQVARSEEAENDPKPRATVRAASQTVQTCHCNQAAKVDIAYRREDGSKATYTACAICDAVAQQPRFAGSADSVNNPAPGENRGLA